jgi:hypothetical protein
VNQEPRVKESPQKRGEVTGFMIAEPTTEATLEKPKRKARPNASSAPRPKVGKMPMKTPTASPRAALCGEASERRKRRYWSRSQRLVRCHRLAPLSRRLFFFV